MKYILETQIIAVVLLMAISNSFAGKSDRKKYGSLTCDEVTSIYDGDTFRCNIKDVHPLLGNRVSIRVQGVDTPEMKAKSEKLKTLARKAKKYTVSFIRNCPEKITLKNVTRGKYFRIVADVYCKDKNLTKSLIKAGLGLEYYGGKKKWR